jgi:DNA helicase-2/ATP-dependent DNA helicase PcrA
LDIANAVEASASRDHGSRITAGLNAWQRAAVLCTDAPLGIVAGPGTGKTRVLTVRVAHLVLEKGVPPESILAITFTNKAAGEMRERLETLLGAETARRVTIRTFHAFGAMLLRQYAGRSGLGTEFVILAEEDQRALLRQACPELKVGEVDAVLVAISAAKNRSASDAPEHAGPDGSRRSAARAGEDAAGASSPSTPSADPFARYRSRYEMVLRKSNAVDFDDLLLLPIRLLETQPDVLAALQARYRWISVDEYQDINGAQYRLLRLLASGGANLCVIGDPDQAIYGFRGSDRRYFLRFEHDYPGAAALHLDHNYRSTQIILDAATQVIARNAGRTALQLMADCADEVRLDVHRAPTDRGEAEYVVHEIEQMMGGTSYFSLDSGRTSGATPVAARSFADFAVLYRLGAQSRPLIEAFDRSGIPYQTSGQTPLRAYKAVREVLACLWLLYSPHSQAHLSQIGGLHRHLMPELTQAWRAGMPAPRLIEQAMALIVRQRGRPYGEADAVRLSQLVLAAAPYEDRLVDFLEAVVLGSETDAYDARADRVALMTLHAAKGLEFPVVFIVGCEEGLLPYTRPGEPPDVEEERRLFYVGMTRAGRRLVLTQARKRMLFGQVMENAPSRFVGDIEAALKQIQEAKRRPPERKPEHEQLSLF